MTNAYYFYRLQKIISNIIDKMGEASGIAQELKSPITSAEKLMRSDHTLYLMTEQTSPGYYSNSKI